MRYERLVTFGCSLTYGHGLPDCVGKDKKHPGPMPSKMGWPNKLATFLGLGSKVENISRPGASNNWIWLNAMDFEFSARDLVVFNWTYLESRWDIKINKEKTIGISPGFSGLESDIYIKHLGHTMKWDLPPQFFLRANFMQYYLNDLGVANYHLTVDPVGVDYHMPSWNKVAFLKPSINDLRPKYPKALDDSHPGEACHAEFARLVRDELVEIGVKI